MGIPVYNEEEGGEMEGSALQFRHVNLSVCEGGVRRRGANIYIYERERERKSKHVLYWKLFTPNICPWGLCQGLPSRLDRFLQNLIHL